jgi:hypothetical protein
MTNAPAGSYEETSRNIEFSGTPGETPLILKAECQKRDGSWVESELRYDIANCDGKLKWAPDGC